MKFLVITSEHVILKMKRFIIVCCEHQCHEALVGYNNKVEDL